MLSFSQNQKDFVILNKYKKIQKIQQQTFIGKGQTFLIQDKKNKQYRMKLLNKKQERQNQDKIFFFWKRQKEILKMNDSQYLPKFVQQGQWQEYFYYIQQFFGQDLLFYQQKLPNKVFQLDQAIQILSQVLKAINYLHDLGYIHGDIKSQCILINKLDNDYQIKLTNLGLCKQQNENMFEGTVLGTQKYMSPQHYQNKFNLGFAIDIWAFGVMFCVMMNMACPFFSNYKSKNLQFEKKYEYLQKQLTNFSYKKFVQNTKKKNLEHCSPQLQNLFKQIFVVDSRKRIQTIKIADNSLFQKNFNIFGCFQILFFMKKGRSIEQFKVINKMNQNKKLILRVIDKKSYDYQNIRNDFIGPCFRYLTKKQSLKLKRQVDFYSYYEDEKYFGFLFEDFGESLQSFMKKHKKQFINNPQKLIKILVQVVKSLEQLHSSQHFVGKSFLKSIYIKVQDEKQFIYSIKFADYFIQDQVYCTFGWLIDDHILPSSKGTFALKSQSSFCPRYDFQFLNSLIRDYQEIMFDKQFYDKIKLKQFQSIKQFKQHEFFNKYFIKQSQNNFNNQKLFKQLNKQSQNLETKNLENKLRLSQLQNQELRKQIKKLKQNQQFVKNVSQKIKNLLQD